MDFDKPWLLMSGIAIGLVGFGLLVYGKKQSSLRFMTVGLAMCVFPYFVTSLAVMWIGAGSSLAALYAWSMGSGE